MDLSNFDISSETGFVSSLPLASLPGEYFSEWERVLSNISELIEKKQLRRVIDSLPERDFNESTLKSVKEWQRAYLMLSFLGQGYIWMEGEAGLVNVVPRKIAIPWFAVSEHLGMQPIGCYATTVLYNYRLQDPSQPMDLDNLQILHTFTGTKDESWFFAVHVLVEVAAVPALKAMATIFNEMAGRNYKLISQNLQTMKTALQDMQKAVDRMYDGCDPKTFFVKMRPFLAGSRGLDAFPKGVIYEGVDPAPKQYYGASAGQSSIIYAFDLFLGTEHSGKECSEFVLAMRDYMPQQHRDFLIELEKMPSIRDYCKASGDKDLVASYDEVVEELVRFRKNHLILATRYIVNQTKHSVNPALDNKGTGGSNLIEFLKEVRDETEAMKIKNE